MGDDFIRTLHSSDDEDEQDADDSSDFEMAAMQKKSSSVKENSGAGREKKKKKKKKKKKQRQHEDDQGNSEESGSDEEAFIFDVFESTSSSSNNKISSIVQQQSVVDKIQRRLLAKETRRRNLAFKSEKKQTNYQEGVDNSKNDLKEDDSSVDEDEDDEDEEGEEEEESDDDDDDEEDEDAEKDEDMKYKRKDYSGKEGTEISSSDSKSLSSKRREKRTHNKEEQTRKYSKTNTAVEVKDFAHLKLSRPLLKAVREMGFVCPTPVQARSIPPALMGKDLLVNAQTGSGKTAAFLLPCLERLLYRSRRIPISRVLVVTPTRELAQQIVQMGQQLAKHTDVRYCLVVGGLSLNAQAVALRSSPDIVVATPGRLIDHLRNSVSVDLDGLEILILDEADRLLDMGFKDELEEVLRLCPRGRQTMLFSATLSENVTELVDLSLREPVRISVDSVSVVDTLQQEFIRIRSQNDNQKYREAVVLALCKRSFSKGGCIVFLPSKKLAHRLMIIFGFASLKAAELHGHLTQQQRLDALELFHRSKVDFLLATDLAARGLDIKKVHAVINYSMPRQVARYIHRVGRTARAGRKGVSVTLVGENGRKNLKSVVKMAKGAGTTKSRQVPFKVISKWRDKIGEMEEDIRAVLDMEWEEKQLRIAEMETNKGMNIIHYQDEIQRRPPRTWFQTEKAKKKAKEISKAAISAISDDNDDGARNDIDTAPLSKGSQQSQRTKKKNPLQGLSRSKKRKKLARMQEEKDRRDYEQRIEEIGGTKKKSPHQRMMEAVQKAKIKRRETAVQKEGKQLNHSKGGANDHIAMNAAVRKAKKRYRSKDNEDDADSFARRYGKIKEKPQREENKKAFANKSRKAFKSKSRYKRRK